ncbi:MAG: LUD domain-containing protein [Candidatus Caldarchaeum sp.]|nr:LUD domain-containing protein [Candidatus Caldarchaeum sp.]
MKKAQQIHRELSEKVAAVLPRKEWRTYLRDALFRTLEKRKYTIKETIPDFEKFRHEVRELKARAVENLDPLLKRFIEKCEKRGAKVFVAKDAIEACEFIYRIAVEKRATLLSKSKSMTTEEIELNKYLEQRGVKIVDTDLGELIIQLAGEKPFHLVYPAVHKTRYEVAEIFSKTAGKQIPPDIPELMMFAREYLRNVFLSADIGITGVNIAIAETGTIVVETNEGNDRLGNIPPHTYIAVMGVDKIVESVEDALKLVVAHPVSSTGQTLTTYVSFITGRNPLESRERELIIVVVDNGRMKMRDDPVFREALYCIRCGACMNICPTYSTVGGHVFGHIYTGPIGIPWTAFVHGLQKAAEFAPLCISCGLCKEICPAVIDMPMMIAEVKHRYRQKGGQLLVNRVVENYERAYRLGAVFPSLFNALINSKTFRRLMEKLFGVDSRRKWPMVADKTFDKLFRGGGGDSANVVLFTDFYLRYVRPDLGMKVVKALEDSGLSVTFPPQKSSGYPYVAYGDLDKARKTAEYNVRNIAKHLDGGEKIVVSVEPTATYALKHVYPKLLPEKEEARKVAEATKSLYDILLELVSLKKLEVKARVDGKAAIHVPCHERAFDSCQNLHALLSAAGVSAVFVETGTCCGMAGTFGMKHGILGYELANTVGEPLFELVKNSGCDFVVSSSSVCSIHLQEGSGKPVYHPLEILEFTAASKR